MLVISRDVGERICIGDDIVIEVRATAPGRAYLAIQAPREVKILREELLGTPEGERLAGETERKEG